MFGFLIDKHPNDFLTVPKRKRKKRVKQATINNMEEPGDEPSGNYHGNNEQSQLSATSASSKAVNSVSSDQSSKLVADRTTFTQSHRRAVSLESTEINQQRNDLSNYMRGNSSSFEVPEFVNRKSNSMEIFSKNNLKVWKESSSLDSVNADRNEISEEHLRSEKYLGETKLEQTSDSTSSLLSKISNLSTSFKASLPSGLFQRIGSREDSNTEDGGTSPKDTIADANLGENLLDDDMDLFTKSSKLQISSDSDCNGQNEDIGTSGIGIEKSSDQDLSREAGREITTQQVDNLHSNDYLSSSNDFDSILGPGDSLSSNDNSIQKMNSVLSLKTPPSTPADTVLASSKECSSSGLVRKLDALHADEDGSKKGQPSLQRKHANGGLGSNLEDFSNSSVRVKEDCLPSYDGNGDTVSQSSR